MFSLDATQVIQVTSVFLAALLAMCVGILLEVFKDRRSISEYNQGKLKREVAQINNTISVIGYNIEALFHSVNQFILPHHNEGHIAYKALLETKGDPQFAMSFPTYSALVTTCPELHLIEWDFFKELPFIFEKDPELLKQSHWLISQSREIGKLPTR
jgi:hypothetical protein